MDWSVNKILEYSSPLFDFSALYDRVSGDRWKNWADQLSEQIPAALEVAKNGHLPLWIDIFEKLPKLPADQVYLDQSIIKVKTNTAIDPLISKKIEKLFLQMVPWRKGPFRIHDVFIDSNARNASAQFILVRPDSPVVEDNLPHCICALWRDSSRDPQHVCGFLVFW